ncbi:MAG: hypothetical protein JW952_04895, partial [Candidatus Eisenbacteria bacterium]|nr:hypothetical protein [Candidatus Eisenbacteria bacterium]
LLFGRAAFAGWPEDGVPICTETMEQEGISMTWDSAGGAIITWVDPRDDVTLMDPYVQRIDLNGQVRWTLDGVQLCGQPILQVPEDIATDGHGGAIVVWHDYRSTVDYDIYAQRVDSTGAPVWTTDGVAVCTASYNQTYPRVIPDGSGGVIVVWQDMRSGASWDVYAQRINASGVVQWSANGIVVSEESGNQSDARIAGDGAGGAYVVWTDSRGDYKDIYAQRLDPSGDGLWIVGGIPVCSAAYDQGPAGVMSDGLGGAIVLWRDRRDNAQWDIYAQRLGQSGSKEWSWAPDGVAICTAEGDQRDARMAPDGNGGAIVAWAKQYSSDLYAQRVNYDGSTRWGANGVQVCAVAASGSRENPDVCSDLHGGAIITWEEERTAGASGYDIYAQRVDSTGALLWPAEAVSVCVIDGWQAEPRCVSNGTGGAIIAWRDRRPSSDGDIYAMRVKADGTTDLLFGSVAAAVQDGAVTLSWQVTVDVPASSFTVRRGDTRDGDFAALDVVVRKDTATRFSCVDHSVAPDRTYWYEIVLAGVSGEERYGPVEVRGGAAPAACRLHQAYPNPFNPVCNVRYEVPTAGWVRLSVFDVGGVFVRELVRAWREPGTYCEVWDGRDGGGSPLPSGVYVCRLEAGRFEATSKTVLLR